MASESRVRCEIDFESSGRQAGYLRAPLSRNTSGWGVVEIPVVSVKNGSGPTILFTGGVHGDEYEGQGLAGKLAKHVLDDARSAGIKIGATCPYVRGYLERHPEEQDLLAAPL